MKLHTRCCKSLWSYTLDAVRIYEVTHYEYCKSLWSYTLDAVRIYEVTH